MRVAWLFGGQGCEAPGMGLHLPADALDPLLAAASEQIGADARAWLRRGGPGWGRTERIQPVLVAVGLATAAALGGRPDAFAGHSLGGLTAWAAAGGCAPADAIALAGRRGRAMAGVPGGMVAGPEHGPAPEGLSLAVVNPGQRVWAGSEAAVRLAVAAGFTRLPVDGPWHGAAMAGAAQGVADALARLPVLDAPGWVGPDDAPARAALAAGVASTFRWDRVLARLDGVEHVVLCGPARPLVAGVRRALPRARLWPTDTSDEVDAARALLEVSAAP